MTYMADSHTDKGEGASAEQRGSWGRQIEFFLTCVGFAVGLGSVWRFPYLAYKHGGGAFLIPFIIMLTVVGLPTFFLELSIGQFSSLGPTAVWRFCPALKGIGWGMIATIWLLSLSYNIIVTYSTFYFLASMGPSLPWETCGNKWNTYLCVTVDQLKNVTNKSLSELNISRSDLKTPSEEFFYNRVLQMTDSVDDTGYIIWQLACCLLLCWAVVFIVLIRGISSLGKVVYFTATFPYVMMTIMLIRVVTLEGAAEGILYYITPDPSKLLNSEVWSDAATQIFYSLSACTGGLIAMSSYNKFSNNCLRDSVAVSVITCLTGVFAGFVIFSALGFMARQKGVTIDKVVAEGPGLVFVVYPEALSQMPAPVVWSLLFFLMMIILGFSTEFSYVETLFVALMDQFPSLRSSPCKSIILRILLISIFYLISLPMVSQSGFFWFNLVDKCVGGFPLLLLGLLEIVAVIWIYGYNRFADDISMMLGSRPHIYFKVTWCVVTPFTLLGVILFRCSKYVPPTVNKSLYPEWCLTVGWLMVTFSVIWIPIFAVREFFLGGGLSVRCI